MQEKSRAAGLFVAGAAAGVIALGAAYLYLFDGGPRSVSSAALPSAAVMREELQPAPAAQPVAAVAAPTACAFQPLLGASDARDGQFMLDAVPAIHRSSDFTPFLAVADEAAREGRMRDTEVALIAACRIASQAGAASAPLADVQTRLAHHYATVAASGDAAGPRTQLLERAETLLADSVPVYASSLGPQASKTRMAQQQLAAVRDPAARLPKPAPLVVAAPQPEPQETTRLGAARSSLAERPPLRTEELTQVDQDLERLYAQARAVSRDPAGMQRRHQQALAQRSACRGDEECLRGWYAQRKRQLFGEF
jgi:hypothetical protein